MRDERKSNSVQQTDLPKLTASRPSSVVSGPRGRPSSTIRNACSLEKNETSIPHTTKSSTHPAIARQLPLAPSEAIMALPSKPGASASGRNYDGR
jgi:hypothetical protein